MFLGEYNHIIDSKGRLTIPARFRPELAQGVVVTRWLDRCLAIFPLSEWLKLAQAMNELPLTDRRARDLRRFVFSGAAEAVPDRQGRVLLPPFLREYAGLGDEATVVGMNTHIEIWNPQAWQGVRQTVEDDEANAERWAELGI